MAPCCECCSFFAEEVIDAATLIKMWANDVVCERNTLKGSHHDAECNGALTEMYETALTSLGNRTIKHQRKNVPSRHGLDFDLNCLDADDDERKTDNSSASTAESDETVHHYESFESMKREGRSSSFLGGAMRGSTSHLKQGIVTRLQQSWSAIRGFKAIDAFIFEAHYPSEARHPC